MQRISLKSYSDVSQTPYPTFSLQERGKALFFGVGYPTEDSRSALACEKAFQIAGDSFLRRPSLADEAMETIARFINEGIFILQDMEKRFRCSAAFLYVYKGMGRVFSAGNALALHYRDGKLTHRFYTSDAPEIGSMLRGGSIFSPEFDISEGTNGFVLCAAGKAVDLNALPLPEPNQTDKSQFDGIIDSFRGTSCSAGAIRLEKREKLFGL